MLTFRIKTPTDQFMDWMEAYRVHFGNLPSILMVDRFTYYELAKDVKQRMQLYGGYPNSGGFGFQLYGVSIMCEGDTNEP